MESNPKELNAMIDIGAHAGIVTKQAMNIAQTQHELFLIEPLKAHLPAIEFNLSSFTQQKHLLNFALSKKNSRAKIYRQSMNLGKASLYKTNFKDTDLQSTIIKTVNARKFFTNTFDNFNTLVLKCDTEGADALICGLIPE
jgi:FkbM family methyltransferase